MDNYHRRVIISDNEICLFNPNDGGAVTGGGWGGSSNPPNTEREMMLFWECPSCGGWNWTNCVYWETGKYQNFQMMISLKYQPGLASNNSFTLFWFWNISKSKSKSKNRCIWLVAGSTCGYLGLIWDAVFWLLELTRRQWFVAVKLAHRVQQDSWPWSKNSNDLKNKSRNLF